MKMYKAILFFTVLLFVSSSVISAQGRMTHEERVQQYKEKLTLTADQTKKLDVILKKSEQKREEMRNSGDMTNMREKMMKSMDETNEQIMKILKPAQKEQFKKMLEERKNRMQGQRQNRPQ
jgi:Spy/CpxP family protein refolding chaperone